MLFIKETNEPLWGKYVADTMLVGGNWTRVDPALDEDGIDNWLLKELSEEAKSTLYRAPANGKYAKTTEG